MYNLFTGIMLSFFFLLSTSISTQAQSDITLEGIWKYHMFSTERVEGFRFMNDGRHFTRLVNNDIKMFDIESGEFVKDILSSEQLGDDLSVSGYEFSEDEKFILFYTNRVQQYRRSFFADYYLWNRETEELLEIGEEPGQMNGHMSKGGELTGFVFENDLYYRNNATGELTRVTEDGKINHIINGASDWVYEEEFYITRTFEWSPDGEYLAFLRFDESDVMEFTMTDYNGGTYPEYTTFKYPKVGEDNSVLTVWIHHTEDQSLIEVPLPFEDFYVPRIYWTPDGELVIYTMNRHQNELSLWLADPETGAKRELMTETNPFYINLHDNLTFTENGDYFIWTSEKDGFNHIYLYNMDGEEVRQLTSGDYDVTAFYGYDPVREKVFFQAAANDPLNREVYSVSLQGGEPDLLAGEKGFNSAGFSSTFDYYILNHSTANQPPRHTVFRVDGEKIRLIENNEDLTKVQNDLELSPVEFFEFKTSEDVLLNGYKILPPDFDENREYPVLMYQYSGPNSQRAVNSWRGLNYWWFQMLARDDYVIVCVDGRGTGGRGEEFRKLTYLELGKYETKDQIETARYLADKTWVDQDRIAIFGWSYGGYISTLALLKGADVFAAGIAVAPVTDWRWYDTIYTERYMRTFEENRAGFTGNSPIHFAHKLEGAYLLVHGLADDNVHFQHTAEMVRALNLEDKDYDLYIYPNNNHSIIYRNARYHLYNKMTNFLNESL
ncbi:MAG: S9 family peptidase [Saprospirales bacterium]|nr:MAG: S9 family peptidase [Saprospirales bacterium]